MTRNTPANTGDQRRSRLRLCRESAIPDPRKAARYARAPELGPKILFFSGGSALRPLSRELIHYTHNSIHLITAFDSGGSSAPLREAFKMLAIGDFRARIMDLADQSLSGNREIYALFNHRLPVEATPAKRQAELAELIDGRHPLVAAISDPMRKIIRNHLEWFRRAMPDGFDLRRASVGNLILTGGYLENRRHPDPVIYLFSKLVEARGIVRPIANCYLHLAARLANKRVVVGQHLLTGKEVPPLTQKIEKIFLTDNRQQPEPVAWPVRRKISELIAAAELICYPMGSFYSSLVANLLPTGVGRAIAANPCPKVYVPNTGHDPESFGLSLSEQVDILLYYGRKDQPAARDRELLNYLVVDGEKGDYPGGIERGFLKRRGIEIIDTPLISDTSCPLLDAGQLLPVLLSLT